MSTEGRTLSPAGRAWQELAEQARERWEAGDCDQAGELFLELQEHSTPWLMAIARRKGPLGLAEELVAQAHLELWGQIEGGAVIRNVKGLLGTILRRRCIDALRQRHGVIIAGADEAFWERHAASTTPFASPPDRLDELEERAMTEQMANAIFAALPAEERAVLVARDIDGLGVAETAIALGLTEDQVKKRRRRAIESARRVIADWGPRSAFD